MHPHDGGKRARALRIGEIEHLILSLAVREIGPRDDAGGHMLRKRGICGLIALGKRIPDNGDGGPGAEREDEQQDDDHSEENAERPENDALHGAAAGSTNSNTSFINPSLHILYAIEIPRRARISPPARERRILRRRTIHSAQDAAPVSSTRARPRRHRVRPDVAFHGQAPPPTVTNHYLVEDGKVRLVSQNGKDVIILKDKTLYALDTAARTAQTLPNATLEEMNAHLKATSQRLLESLAKDPPEKRATETPVFERLAADNEKRARPLPSDYVMSNQSESVGGQACRLWERSENGILRRQICVAPVNEVPGGADILAGMKSLSEVYGGSIYALGLGFGLSPWWSSIESLRGVPLLIREFGSDGSSTLFEVTFTGIHVEPKNASLFDIPDGYERKGNPLAPPVAKPAAAAPTR